MPEREDRHAPTGLAGAAKQGNPEGEVGRYAEHGAQADIAGLLHADRAGHEKGDGHHRVDHGLQREDGDDLYFDAE